jgi:hypothetical protein
VELGELDGAGPDNGEVCEAHELVKICEAILLIVVIVFD